MLLYVAHSQTKKKVTFIFRLGSGIDVFVTVIYPYTQYTNLLLCDVCSLADFPAANRNVLGDTIVIRNAQASDSAVYQCEAANVHGKLLSNANIMIMSEFAAGKKQETRKHLRPTVALPNSLQIWLPWF